MDANFESQSKSLPGTTNPLSILPPITLKKKPCVNILTISDLLTDSHGNDAQEITHKRVHSHPSAGYVHHTRVIPFTSSSSNGYHLIFNFACINKRLE